jgi:serine/threonine protein kinase
MRSADGDDLSDVRDAPAEATRTMASGQGGATGCSPPPAQEWGDLRLLAEIGHGAFGRVHRAWDPALAREVALKIIPVPDVSQSASVLGEGRLLARIRHPNVVTVYGARQVGGDVGLWMELVRGRRLAGIVRNDGPMGPEEATLIGISVCRALAAVHAAGLIHRDVKAQNVMRELGGRIVLMDFGEGRDIGDLETSDRSDLSGTPVYMAPELFRGGRASAQSDIYSVGVLLFYLVTGRYPVDGYTLAEVMVALATTGRRQLSDLRPDLPHDFVRAVEMAMQRLPCERPQSASALMRELTRAMAGMAIDPGLAVTSAAADAYPAREPVRLEPVPALPAASLVAALPHPDPAASSPVRQPDVSRSAVMLGAGLLSVVVSTVIDTLFERTQVFSGVGSREWWHIGARPLIGAIAFIVVFLALTRTANVAFDLGARWRGDRARSRGRAGGAPAKSIAGFRARGARVRGTGASDEGRRRAGLDSVTVRRPPQRAERIRTLVQRSARLRPAARDERADALVDR